MKRILVFGLPESGKTTFSEILVKVLDADWYNADQIRMKYNDWDFSEIGRRRQAFRMYKLTKESQSNNRMSVADFICPTKEYRQIFDADYSIWMNTIDLCKYENTNNMWQIPSIIEYDLEITSFLSLQEIEVIGNIIINKE